MYKALELPLETDIQPLLLALRERGVQVVASEEGGRQCVWTASPGDVLLVQHAWQVFRAGEWQVPDTPLVSSSQGRMTPSIPVQRYPLTVLVLAITGLVFVMTWLLQDVRLLSLLSFEALVMRSGEAVGLRGFEAGWRAGEYWRVLTPVFLHFGVLHIVFNSLWWWELGRRIEVRCGSVFLLGLFLLSAVTGNVGQYLAGRWWGEPSLFGGLSGVIYGLIGYIAVWNALRPSCRYDVPRGLIGLMIGFLLVCMTGVMEWVGLGRVANAAHVGGLLAGVVWGLLAVVLARQHRV